MMNSQINAAELFAAFHVNSSDSQKKEYTEQTVSRNRTVFPFIFPFFLF